MVRKLSVSILAVALVLTWGAGSAFAGAKITINDDSEINLGFRLQTLFMSTESDRDGDGDFEDLNDFKVRRARIRLGANVTKWVSIFLQTEFSEGAGSGGDVRLIDAFVKVKPHPWLTVIAGEGMAPVLRQNVTSSGGLMALDRPGVVYKNLTWGARALHTFSNRTFGDADSGLRGNVGVRDMGLTLFGSGEVGGNASLKYYLGVYDGIQNGTEDNERFAGRVQVNLLDREPGYFNLSTYLGKKKTIAIGAAFDTQAEVEPGVDYAQWTIDLFADYPLGAGSLTFEAAWINLDLDDAHASSEGDGYYVQAGYFINNWQPWVEYESWSSDAANDLGSYDTYRFGVSYFLKGHNANFKVGYEVFNADQNIDSTNEDSIGTFIAGIYVTY